MSAVALLLKRAKDAGVTPWTDGDAIHYRAPRDALARLVPELKAHKPAILAALACPAADLIQAQLDYQQDLVVYAEERRQSDEAEAELRRLAAIRRQAYEARTTPELATHLSAEDLEDIAAGELPSLRRTMVPWRCWS